MTKNEKISQSLKRHFADNGHHNTGKQGKCLTDDERKIHSERMRNWHQKKGLLTEKEKKARNKANVYAYRARLRNAIPEDSDLSLIRLIYENCPEGYHVDHIQALARGGLHHQDNLQYLPISENCRKGSDRSYDTSLAVDWKQFIPQ
jgi:hypothetical protein